MANSINTQPISEALVTMDVHSRDVVAELYKERVIAATDFKWMAQLRYYWMVGTREKSKTSKK